MAPDFLHCISMEVWSAGCKSNTITKEQWPEDLEIDVMAADILRSQFGFGGPSCGDGCSVVGLDQSFSDILRPVRITPSFADCSRQRVVASASDSPPPPVWPPSALTNFEGAADLARKRPLHEVSTNQQGDVGKSWGGGGCGWQDYVDHNTDSNSQKPLANAAGFSTASSLMGLFPERRSANSMGTEAPLSSRGSNSPPLSQQQGLGKPKTLGPARCRSRPFQAPWVGSTSCTSEAAPRGSDISLKQATVPIDAVLSSSSAPRRGRTEIGDENEVDDEVAEVLKALGGGESGSVSRGGAEIRGDVVAVVLSMRMGAAELVQEEDVVGLPEVKKLLRDKIINPILRPDLHIGLHRAPRGILLFGPPGTGKTTLAKWMATASRAKFFEVTPSALISKFHGETETLVKTLFRVAELQSPSLLFIDEIDSLLGKRRDKEEDATIRMKNQLLQMMDGVGSDPTKMVVIVGATNRPDMLDEAALRRLTKRVLVPMPDAASRARQIENLLKKHSVGGSGTLSASECMEVAEKLEGWNGSDVKALCSKAADFSYDETVKAYGGIENIPDRTAFRPIQLEDFTQATGVVRPSTNVTDMTVDYINWAEQFGCF